MWIICSDFSLLAKAGSEIPDRHPDCTLAYEPAAGQRICLRPNTEPILAQLKGNPFGSHNCCLTHASLYPHATETTKMNSIGSKTQALRPQQFTREISKFRNTAMANRCKPSKGGLNPTNAVSKQLSNIRRFSGPSLSANAKPRCPKSSTFARRNLYSEALDSFEPLAGQ